MRSWIVAPVVACSLGCQRVPSSTVSMGEPSSKPNPGASASASEGHAVVVAAKPGPQRAEPVAVELPACPAEPDRAIYCTGDGKLVGRWMPVDLVRVPDDVEIVFDAEGSNHDQSRLWIGIRDETLYLRHVTCGACRRVMGHGFIGELDHLSDEQRRAIQTLLGLPDTGPLLGTAEAWITYSRDPAGIAALTVIARRQRARSP